MGNVTFLPLLHQLSCQAWRWILKFLFFSALFSGKMTKRVGKSRPFQMSFEISGGILRNQKITIGLDSFSNQRLLYCIWFYLDYTNLCIKSSLAPCCQIYRVTVEAYVAETAVWPIPCLINIFTVLFFIFWR